MPEMLILFRNQPFKKIAQIQRYVRICILLNEQRAGRVLNESRQQAIGNALFAQPVLHLARERIKTFAAGWHRKSCMADHDPV